MRKSVVALAVACTLMFTAGARADESALRHARQKRAVGIALATLGTTASAAGLVVGVMGAQRVGCDSRGWIFNQCTIMQFSGLSVAAIGAVALVVPGVVLWDSGEKQAQTLRASLDGAGARLSLTF